MDETARMHSLELVSLAPDEWRLCDHGAPSDDAAHLVAYIERDATGFEVVWLQGGVAPGRFQTLEDALSAAARMVADIDTYSPHRPEPAVPLADGRR